LIDRRIGGSVLTCRRCLNYRTRSDVSTECVRTDTSNRPDSILNRNDDNKVSSTFAIG